MNFRGVLLQLVEPLYQTLLEPQGCRSFFPCCREVLNRPALLSISMIVKQREESRLRSRFRYRRPAHIRRNLRHAEFAFCLRQSYTQPGLRAATTIRMFFRFFDRSRVCAFMGSL